MFCFVLLCVPHDSWLITYIITLHSSFLSLLPPSHNTCILLWDAQSLVLVAASILLQPPCLKSPTAFQLYTKGTRHQWVSTPQRFGGVRGWWRVYLNLLGPLARRSSNMTLWGMNSTPRHYFLPPITLAYFYGMRRVLFWLQPLFCYNHLVWKALPLSNCTPKELATSEFQPHFSRAGSGPLDFYFFFSSLGFVTRDLATSFGLSSFFEVLPFLACLLSLPLTIWPSSTPRSFLLPPA